MGRFNFLLECHALSIIHASILWLKKEKEKGRELIAVDAFKRWFLFHISFKLQNLNNYVPPSI